MVFLFFRGGIKFILTSKHIEGNSLYSRTNVLLENDTTTMRVFATLNRKRSHISSKNILVVGYTLYREISWFTNLSARRIEGV